MVVVRLEERAADVAGGVEGGRSTGSGRHENGGTDQRADQQGPVQNPYLSLDTLAAAIVGAGPQDALPFGGAA
jgi:hypothetical protein